VDQVGKGSNYWGKRHRKQADYAANPKRCPICNELIPFDRRTNTFCSKSCASSKGAKLCKHCSNPVSERQNKYCDQCIAQRIYDPKCLSMMRLEELKSDQSRRKWLLEQREHQCEYCGLTEWRGQPIPLDLHHEDGDTDNNTEANLKLICLNCHAQTPTHKRSDGLKQGKRQLMRRKRYADGKTW